jgi:hypothetical protein
MQLCRLIARVTGLLIAVVPASAVAQSSVQSAETVLAVAHRDAIDVSALGRPTGALTCCASLSWLKLRAVSQSPAPRGVESKSPHRFFDSLNVALTGLESGALLADGITTQRAIAKYPLGHEADPIARVFVSHGWPGQIAGGILFVSADVGLRYALHRHGHHRLERLLPLVLTVYGATGAIHNARVLGSPVEDR